jgi:hypothetical protein
MIDYGTLILKRASVPTNYFELLFPLHANTLSKAETTSLLVDAGKVKKQ